MSREAGKPVPHYTWQLRAVTIPGTDSELSIVLQLENERYLIGAGEGTQRAVVQKRVALSKLRAILINSGGSESRGGLPGLLMSQVDGLLSSKNVEIANLEGKLERERGKGHQDVIQRYEDLIQAVRWPKLDVIGPPGIAQYLASMKSSLYREGVKFGLRAHPAQHTDGQPHLIFEEYSQLLKISSVALRPEVEPESESFSPVPASRHPWELPSDELEDWCGRMVTAMLPGDNTRAKVPLEMAFQPLPLPPSNEVETEMIYIFQGPPIAGKFDNAKATALKLPFGRVRGDLVRGETIQFPDPDVPGAMKTVRPEEVVGETLPGPVMIMVNCSDHNLDALLSSSALEEFRSGRSASVIVHRVTNNVLRDKRFHDWVQSFGPQTKHLIADISNPSKETFLRATAWNTLKMSIIDPEIFPLPHQAPHTPDQSILPPNAEYLTHGFAYNIHPSGVPHNDLDAERDRPFPQTEAEIKKAKARYTRDLPDFARFCDTARKAVSSDPRWANPSTEPGADITVTTLGTGSAAPSKHRNVSSTHIDIPGVGGVILDSGEGTVGQLHRRFGPDIGQVYRDLRVVFISHMHADHHLGVQALLQDRFKHGVTSKLYLVAPTFIAISMTGNAPWQHQVSQEALDNLVFIDNQYLVKGTLTRAKDGATSDAESDAEKEVAAAVPVAIPESEAFQQGRIRWPRADILEKNIISKLHAGQAVAQLRNDLGLVGFRTPIMKHRGRAWGLVMEHESGWKIAYSGDTMPCSSFINASHESTLIIHEATLDDDHVEMAKMKGHSTFSQAVGVGLKAKAKHILLNHFSQRYPRIARYEYRDEGDYKPDITISFDLMSVKVRDMWRMEHYMDALSWLFPPEEGEDDGPNDDDVIMKENGQSGRAWSPSKKTPPPEGKKTGNNGNRAKKGGQGDKGKPRQQNGDGRSANGGFGLRDQRGGKGQSKQNGNRRQGQERERSPSLIFKDRLLSPSKRAGSPQATEDSSKRRREGGSDA